MALISHWTLDNTAVSTTAVNDGTASNITYSGTDKVTGYNSAYLNGKSSAGGSNAYISVDSLNINAYTNYSFSMWVKSNNEYTDPEPLFLFGRSNSDYYRTTLQKPNAGNTVLFSCIVAGSWQTTTGTKVAFDGTWHHVVCITAGNPSANTKIYVDGVFDSELNYTRDSTATDRGTFGALRWNANNPYADHLLKGYLDDIRFYSHALTTTEITALYNDRYKPKWQTPLARWSLDSTPNDAYGSLNGTASGTVEYSAAQKVSGNYSMKCDGGADYINAGNWQVWSYTNFTISFWFRSTATSMFFTNSKIGGNRTLYAIYTVDSTLYVNIFNDAGNASICTWTENNSYNNGVWRHMTITDANGTVAVYIDGGAKTPPSPYTRIASVCDTVSIAALRNDTTLYATGNLDDIRFYDTALTAAEVKSLYQSYFTEKAISFMGIMGV